MARNSSGTTAQVEGLNFERELANDLKTRLTTPAIAPQVLLPKTLL
jgi:hypothetical protein